jgi:hypothetical protein
VHDPRVESRENPESQLVSSTMGDDAEWAGRESAECWVLLARTPTADVSVGLAMTTHEPVTSAQGR